jgi:hypothetical protein
VISPGITPVPVQQLIGKQLERVEGHVRKVKPLPHYEDNTLFCHCGIGREYWLPCKRVFYLDMYIQAGQSPYLRKMDGLDFNG